jgi:hypothetical protein
VVLILAFFWLRRPRHRATERPRLVVVRNHPTETTHIAPAALAIDPFTLTQHVGSGLSGTRPKGAEYLSPVSLLPTQSETLTTEDSLSLEAELVRGLEELLRLDAVGRMLEQWLADVLARMRPGGGGSNEMSPEYAER